jgi:hypothetical protein
MILSFLIATLVIFSFNLIISLLAIGVSIQIQQVSLIHLINVVIALIMISWNIVALISL